jgi:hypothetical protein
LLYECRTSYLLYLKLTQADFSEVAAAFFSDHTPPPATRLSDTEQSEEEEAEESTASEVRKKRGLEEETETETEGVGGGGGAENKRANLPQSVTHLEEERPQWEAGRKEPVGGEEEERAEQETAREREQQSPLWGAEREAAVGGEDAESGWEAGGTNQPHEWHDENEAFLNHVASMQRNFSEYYTDDDCGVQIMGGKVKLALL